MRDLLARAPVRIGAFLAGLVLALVAGYGIGALVGDGEAEPVEPTPTHAPGHEGAAATPVEDR